MNFKDFFNKFNLDNFNIERLKRIREVKKKKKEKNKKETNSFLQKFFQKEEKKFSFKDLFKKYNYDIQKVVGVKDNNRYILYADKKLIRIYRNKLKSTALLSSYIPIEHAIFYNFEVEKNVIMSEDVDVRDFIETKVYEEAGLSETEEYIIKYKIIDKLKDEKRVLVQTVIVAKSYIEKDYEYILKKTDYIDYLSFPAFAYKSLYEEEILKKATDLFIVVMDDKIFLTFYDGGELLYISNIASGLNIIYKDLESLEIEGFDEEVFKKLLKQKGLSENRYNHYEKPVYTIIKNEFFNMGALIEEQIKEVAERYYINDIDRIFITSQYGDIQGIDILFEHILNKKSLNFEFYEEYNLDRLDVDPFLFLAMLEAHYAYRFNNFRFNFSLFLRRPTFFYRPSGMLISFTVILFILLTIYPIFMYLKGVSYQKEVLLLKGQKRIVSTQKEAYEKKIKKLESELSKLDKEKAVLQKEISKYTSLIQAIYDFKFKYVPKSQELAKITYLMNKNNIFLDTLTYENGEFIINIYSYDDKNFGKFLNDLVNSGLNVNFDVVKKNFIKYSTTIRIKE